MKALATKKSVLVDEWDNCYRGGWRGVIVDEAFSHPAKVAFNLAKRIYEHAIERGWIQPNDVVVDPFGGIGGCAFHGLMNGMRVVTCELEEKFVNLSKQNRELWRKQYTGLPGFNADNWIIVQGDSRRLASVISEAGLSVSSPPYAGYDDHGGRATAAERDRRRLERLRPDLSGRFDTCFKGSEEYGSSEGQLGAMKEGDLSLVVSSPPYASGEKGHPSLGSVNKDDWGNDGRDITRRRGLTGEYGSTSGNVAQMPEGSLAISSPPYEDAIERHRPQGDNKIMREKAIRANYDQSGFNSSNLGSASGDTFWSASRTILEQLYSVLSPGAHAIFIVKSFVRDKKIVDFPGQWAQLCEAVGFKLIHDHHALLTEHSGTQGGMFGEDKEHKVKRISFFRRLHEKKSPETAIDYENVLCFERP